MTSPAQPSDGLLGQVLIKQGEILAELTGIKVTLQAVPDHETRLRVAEALLTKLNTTIKLVGTAAVVLSGIIAALISGFHH